jgi:hypothetical protein
MGLKVKTSWKCWRNKTKTCMVGAGWGKMWEARDKAESWARPASHQPLQAVMKHLGFSLSAVRNHWQFWARKGDDLTFKMTFHPLHSDYLEGCRGRWHWLNQGNCSEPGRIGWTKDFFEGKTTGPENRLDVGAKGKGIIHMLSAMVTCFHLCLPH